MSTRALISQALNNFVFDEYENFKTLQQQSTNAFSEMIISENSTLNDEYVVYAPTQMGKTGYMLNACKLAKDSGTLIVISVDNKKDQLDQTFTRFSDCGMPHFKVNEMNTLNINKNLKKGKSVIIFCLNNASQVSKLCNISHRRITVIHDEGDLIHQSDCDEETGKTQEAWAKFCDTNNPVRIWVSATPENCSFIRGIKVKNVLRLPVNPDYTPVSHFVEWDTKDYNILVDAVENINPEDREVTLFCTDSKVKNHIDIAENISLLLPECVVVVYNGTESYTIQETIKTPFGCPISEILTEFEDEDVNIIVIGHALLSRGISFCSKGINGQSYMATRMFYLGDNAHAVALSQRFGRIAGTCRPDLNKRTVYCSRDVYANYRGYLDNQVKVLDTECDLDMVAALTKIENKRILSCKLDRATMRKTNSEYVKKTNEKTDEIQEDLDDDYEMKRLIKRWWSANTIIGKVLKFVHAHPSVDESVLIDFIKSTGSKNPDKMYHHLTTATKNYRLVFSRTAGKTYINRPASTFIATL